MYLGKLLIQITTAHKCCHRKLKTFGGTDSFSEPVTRVFKSSEGLYISNQIKSLLLSHHHSTRYVAFTYVAFQLYKPHMIYPWVILITHTVPNWTLNVNTRSRKSTLIHRISRSINHLPDIDRNWLEEIWVNGLIWLSVAIIETQMSIQNDWHIKNAVTYD